ncbi:MAG: c-type cytochrome [Magnetococcales bacterium]|nr:c-type cytochrome [Magnetococcales bacterium]
MRKLVLGLALWVPLTLGADPAHEAGRAVYNFRCYFCHGYSGNGRTLAASYLTPKPRDFTRTAPEALPLERMIASIRHGVPSTGMAAFETVLTPAEIEAVAAFVRQEFMVDKAENTRYHTVANGWGDHERYREAYPFALGEIAMDRAEETLTPEQRRGKALYLSACISCHDWGRVEKEEPVWEPRAVSYPRAGFVPGQESVPDAVSGASVYARHDRAPVLSGEVSQAVREGERLFQGNCAFCHAADGTGKNWIGTFLQPHPRDLTEAGFKARRSREGLKRVMAEGLAGTSMPAWRGVLSEGQMENIAEYIEQAM